MATHFSIFARIILWTEEPGGLSSMGSQRETTETTRMHHLIPNALKGCAEQEAKRDSLRCEVQTQVRCPSELTNCGARYLPVLSKPQKACLIVLQINHSRPCCSTAEFCPNACEGVPEQQATTVRGPDSSDSQHVSVCRQPSTRVVMTSPDTECPAIHTGGHCLPWKP